MDSVVVLLSAYNGEKYIEEQIESIIHQKGDFRLTIIVRDDGSLDNTSVVLQRYYEQGKIILWRGENIGVTDSFLLLLNECGEFDYYCFSDQDDVWFEDKIIRAIKSMNNYKDIEPALYCSNAVLVKERLENLGRKVNRMTPKTDFYTLCSSGGLLGCTMVMNHMLVDIIRTNKKEKKVVLHDFFVAVLCKAIGGVIVYDDYPTMYYRQHMNNVVGVPVGWLNTIKNRFLAITTCPNIRISDQAKTILDQYRNEISEDKQTWLNIVSLYPERLLTRISLALSRKTKYVSLNMGIKIRLSILLGNR